MGVPILIMGRSGTGKTASLRELKNIFIINVLNKPLSYRAAPELKQLLWSSDDYAKIKGSLLKYAAQNGGRCAIIDDAGYLMTDKFMSGHGAGKGNAVFELYNTLADDFYSLIKFIVRDLPADFIAYVVMHEDKNDFGESRPKTIGKILDDKVCVEGMFTIVLRSLKVDGKYVFATNTDGFDVAKTPLGMFDERLIDNNLAFIDKTVREFYGFAPNEPERKEEKNA